MNKNYYKMLKYKIDCNLNLYNTILYSNVKNKEMKLASLRRGLEFLHSEMNKELFNAKH